MANKVPTIVDTQELTEITASRAALEAYNFALRNAGIEMDEETEADFITARNAKSGWRDLWELKTNLEKGAASIKEVVKHAWNVGTDDQIPSDDGIKISWSKQSYTYEWSNEDAPCYVAKKLIEWGLVSAEQLFFTLGVNQIVKAAGITTEKLMQMFEGDVIAKPKERTLTIK